MIIHVTVRQGKKPIAGEEPNLIVYTSEKRENNRANLDVIRQVAEYYGLDWTGVKIISGRSSRKKVLLVVK